jgi:hypothetical protein
LRSFSTAPRFVGPPGKCGAGVRITNATTSLDICVVHLRRPVRNDGIEKQREQCRALLRWAMRHLSENPKANHGVLVRPFHHRIMFALPLLRFGSDCFADLL